jgi:predicted HicB family RNase H-like nuclease
MKDLMQYKGYYGSVHFEYKDLVFHGKIQFIRALVTYEATDAKGLKKAFEEAVLDYLAMCLDQKIEPEKPFKGSLNVRLGPQLHRRVAIAAEQHYLSINKFIADTLDRAVE